ARGSSYGEKPTALTTQLPTQKIRQRATLNIPAVSVPVEEPEILETQPTHATKTRKRSPELPAIPSTPAHTAKTRRRTLELPVMPNAPAFPDPHPLAPHRSWLTRFFLVFGGVVIGLLVLSSAGIFLRQPNAFQSIPLNSAQSFPIISVQLGGNLQVYNTWEHSSGPIPVQVAVPTNPGPYSVLGKPTISADFINQVLASYHSPTAGMGQTLYDLGVKYGIDPVYPLAFFMHESLFGTTGEARVTLSLGNSRCIPDRPCIDQNRGGYAQMNSWPDGFEQWYKLIRNLYIAQWGRVTIDQIIPKYAPNSDGNNEAVYIATLKHEIDTWRAGILRP
ncbi:MAG: hypothetical protein ACRDHZ_01265, partial [Ktedonobacteraceae bacterium]